METTEPVSTAQPPPDESPQREPDAQIPPKHDADPIVDPIPEIAAISVPDGTRVRQCHECEALGHVPKSLRWWESARCPQCNARLRVPDNSLHTRMAVFLFALCALILLPAALQEPMIAIRRPNGIVLSGFADGVLKLWRLESFGLAILVAVFSGVFPVLKTLMLIVVSLFPDIRHSHRRFVVRIVHLTATLSVLDAIMVGVLAMSYIDMMVIKVSLEPGVNIFLLMASCLILAGFISLRAEGR